MIDAHLPAARASERRRLTRWMAAAAAIVLFRTALFLIHGQLSFDSDQAVIGLMGKHLMERRAFPLFLYGQNYVLAVEAWMAAPMFAAFGVSIATLKLSLFLMNVAVGLQLMRSFVDDAGLGAREAFVAALFFLLPSPGASSSLMEALGGNIEPLLYILLLWRLRGRPEWFGLVAGLGFLQREFTAYGVAALFVVEALNGDLFSRVAARRWFARLRVAVVAWLFVQWVRAFSSPAGPGTTMADVHAASNNLSEVIGRFCLDPRLFGLGMWRLATVHWGDLFGAARIPLDAFGMYSKRWQGLPYSGLFLAAGMLFVVVRLVAGVVARRGERTEAAPGPRAGFCAYLTIASAISALLYALGRCGGISVVTVRYDLMALPGACALVAWFLSVEKREVYRRIGTAVVVLWATFMGASHMVLWAEYVPHAPVTEKERVIRALESRGVRYAIADYWLCYYIDFLTNERIVVSSANMTRVPSYERIVGDHKPETVVISREACWGGTNVMPGVYFCPP